MEYDNDLRGVLFKNDRRTKDTQPDYKGSCEIEGVEYWISSWIKDGKKGKFMSLSFEAKETEAEAPAPAPAPRQPARREAPQRSAPAGNGFDGIDDDVPF